MSISPARAAAFDILLRIEQQDAFASELLHSSHYARLSPADHALTMELTMGVLRWQSLLDKHIAQQSAQKLSRLDCEVLIAIRLAVYQLLFLDRVPARAAVHESVELVKRARKRSAVPFTNAVLRKFAGAIPAFPVPDAQTTLEIAESCAHPLWLVERWIQEFGLTAARKICEHDQQVSAAFIVLRGPELQTELEKEGIKLASGRLLSLARSVTAGEVTRSRAFHEGRIAIQDEASQLVALLLGEGANILDCCAAPGGKTRVLAQQNPGSTIIAADIHPHRARLLRELVTASNVRVIAADIRALPTSQLFDRVLVDAPCSGTGTLARHPEIKWRLKPEDLADLQLRQTAILQSAMQHVDRGGRLVYSTCSLQREENQAVVDNALAHDRSFRLLECAAELERLRASGALIWPDISSLTNGPYLQTIPGIHPCDGFFAAILRRN